MIETIRVSSKGQIVLPKAMRDGLQLEEGAILTVAQDGDCIILRKVQLPDQRRVEQDLAVLREFRKRAPQLSASEIDAVIAAIRQEAGADRRGHERPRQRTAHPARPTVARH